MYWNLLSTKLLWKRPLGRLGNRCGDSNNLSLEKCVVDMSLLQGNIYQQNVLCKLVKSMLVYKREMSWLYANLWGATILRVSLGSALVIGPWFGINLIWKWKVISLFNSYEFSVPRIIRRHLKTLYPLSVLLNRVRATFNSYNITK
jgi:hypothetical protein